MNEYRYLFEILRCALFSFSLSEETKSALDTETLGRIFEKAKSHDIAHIFAYALEKLGLIEEGSEFQNKCANEQILAVYRYENQKYEQSRICGVFDKNNIDFMLLKGAVIRDYYPESWLRSSCDIDILIKPEDSGKAISLIKNELDYTFEKTTDHDYQMYSQSGVHLELHYVLTSGSDAAADKPLEKIWERAVLLDGMEHGYRMDDDTFCYYHILHLAKHIKNGGCGIKPFLDMCYIDKFLKCGDAYKSMLEEGGLAKAEEVVRQLCDAWFFEGSSSDKTERLENYVLTGGVYGNMTNIVAIQKEAKGGTYRYAFSRIFMPYEKMCVRYPNIKGKRWLMPFYQVKRWFDIIFVDKRVKNSIDELVINQNIDSETLNEAERLKADLGL